MPLLTLPPVVREQLEVWLDGLNTGLLADPVRRSAPENLEVRANLGGQSIVEWLQGQKDLYNVLLAKDGSNLLGRDFTPLMMTTAKTIVASYVKAADKEYEVSPGRSKIKRSDMRAFLQDMVERS